MIISHFMVRMSEAMYRFVGRREGNRNGWCDRRKGGHAGDPYRQPKKHASGQCYEHTRRAILFGGACPRNRRKLLGAVFKPLLAFTRSPAAETLMLNSRPAAKPVPSQWRKLTSTTSSFISDRAVRCQQLRTNCQNGRVK